MAPAALIRRTRSSLTAPGQLRGVPAVPRRDDRRWSRNRQIAARADRLHRGEVAAFVVHACQAVADEGLRYGRRRRSGALDLLRRGEDRAGAEGIECVHRAVGDCRVLLPASAVRSSPTATNRPSRTASALAPGRASSTVLMRALSTSRSTSPDPAVSASHVARRVPCRARRGGR